MAVRTHAFRAFPMDTSDSATDNDGRNDLECTSSCTNRQTGYNSRRERMDFRDLRTHPRLSRVVVRGMCRTGNVLNWNPSSGTTVSVTRDGTGTTARSKTIHATMTRQTHVIRFTLRAGTWGQIFTCAIVTVGTIPLTKVPHVQKLTSVTRILATMVD
eukprot:COSAG06_NODE_22646_length_717_cov_0.810680_1_plen_157_part_10